MSKVIVRGNWRIPLDCILYMTHAGQSFKYFNQHTYQTPSPSKGTFDQYTQLPAELQLRIMQHCDAPTRFQLMHTTRDVRIEAREIFFADPAVWYRLEADLLLKNPSTGASLYDPCFMASIKQLEIHSLHLNSRSWRPDLERRTFESPDHRFKYVDEHVKTKIRAFWIVAQQLCPQVRRIMITKDGTSFPDENIIINCFETMAKSCPSDFDVFLYTTEPAEEAVDRRRKRVLWRLRGHSISGFTPEIENSIAPMIFVIPPEKPHRGRVGDFIAAQRIWDKYRAQHSAAEFHRAAAVEQYHFQGRHEPFGCSEPQCEVSFDQPEQYTTHLLATGHGEGEGRLEHWSLKLPLVSNQQLDESHNMFWSWWGLEDHAASEQREMASRAVMHRLEHDVLYAQDKPVA